MAEARIRPCARCGVTAEHSATGHWCRGCVRAYRVELRARRRAEAARSEALAQARREHERAWRRKLAQVQKALKS